MLSASLFLTNPATGEAEYVRSIAINLYPAGQQVLNFRCRSDSANCNTLSLALGCALPIALKRLKLQNLSDPAHLYGLFCSPSLTAYEVSMDEHNKEGPPVTLLAAIRLSGSRC